MNRRPHPDQLALPFGWRDAEQAAIAKARHSRVEAALGRLDIRPASTVWRLVLLICDAPTERTKADLAAALEVSPRQAQRAICAAEQIGCLEVIRKTYANGGQAPSTYALGPAVSPPEWEGVIGETPGRHRGDISPRMGGSHRGDTGETFQKNCEHLKDINPWIHESKISMVHVHGSMEAKPLGTVDQKNILLWVKTEEAEDLARRLFDSIDYAGTAGGQIWKVAAAITAGKLPEAAAWSAANATRLKRPTNRPAYFWAVLADEMAKRSADLADILRTVRLTPDWPSGPPTPKPAAEPPPPIEAPFRRPPAEPYQNDNDRRREVLAQLAALECKP